MEYNVLDAFGYDIFTHITGYARVPRRLVRAFQDATGSVKPAQKLLDFGCGTGFLTKAFLTAQPDLQITGMEPSAYMLKQYRKKFAQNDNIETRSEGYKRWKALNIPSDSYDIVAASGVFDHIKIDGFVAREFMRVVKPGGHLAFTFERNIISNANHIDKEDFQSHSPRYVRKLLEDAGAEILSQKKLVGYVLPRLALLGMIIARKPERNAALG